MKISEDKTPLSKYAVMYYALINSSVLDVGVLLNYKCYISYNEHF